MANITYNDVNELGQDIILYVRETYFGDTDPKDPFFADGTAGLDKYAEVLDRSVKFVARSLLTGASATNFAENYEMPVTYKLILDVAQTQAQRWLRVPAISGDVPKIDYSQYYERYKSWRNEVEPMLSDALEGLRLEGLPMLDLSIDHYSRVAAPIAKEPRFFGLPTWIAGYW